MSRSGYSDDCNNWDLIRWRGAVKSSIRGKRGQAFLREMLESLDALPEKKLEKNILVEEGACCAMGAVAIKRGVDVSEVDPDDREEVSNVFGIAEALAAEIAYLNDEGGSWWNEETPEKRFERMRAWVVSQIKTGDNI